MTFILFKVMEIKDKNALIITQNKHLEFFPISVGLFFQRVEKLFLLKRNDIPQFVVVCKSFELPFLIAHHLWLSNTTKKAKTLPNLQLLSSSLK